MGNLHVKSRRKGARANAIGRQPEQLFEVRGYIAGAWKVKRVKAMNGDAARKSANDDGMRVADIEIAKPRRTHAASR